MCIISVCCLYLHIFVADRDGILDYDFLENLEDIDYDRAFAITSEVIAMEIVNRLLITFFEVLRQHLCIMHTVIHSLV